MGYSDKSNITYNYKKSLLTDLLVSKSKKRIASSFIHSFIERFSKESSLERNELLFEFSKMLDKKKLYQSISKIFETKGEEFFRKFEEKVTLKKLKLSSAVISLGGGAFSNKNVRQEVLKSHISFWLNWDKETLLNRIKNSKKRPLAVNSTEEDLINLIKKRSSTYCKALYEIKCDNLSKNEIVNNILETYETH